MAQESIIHKINALLNKTVENGASEAEAETALAMAQNLMAKHMIESSQLAEHAKDKKCKKVTAPIFKTAYDTTGLNGNIASAFDCKCWWNSYHKEIYFFGFGDDAKLAAYFYNYLNNVIVNEAEKYKKSDEFMEEKSFGYHGKTLLSSFRKGMIRRLLERLSELKAERSSNIIKTTGTDLVIVKESQVEEEYENLGLKLRTKRTNLTPHNSTSFLSGVNKADEVNMAGGIAQNDQKELTRALA